MTEFAIYKNMKKSFVTYALIFFPLTCYANSSPQWGGIPLLWKITIGVFIFIFIAVIWIIFDTKRENKKNDEQRNIKEDKNSNYKNKISENLDLRSEKVELEEKLSKKEEEIKKLKKDYQKKITK